MCTGGEAPPEMDCKDKDNLRVKKPRAPVNINMLSQLMTTPNIDIDDFSNADLQRELVATRIQVSTLVEQLVVATHLSEWQVSQLVFDVERLKRAGGIKMAGKAPDFVKLLTAELQEYSPAEPPLQLARHVNEETADQRRHKEYRDEVWDPYSNEWEKKGKTWGKLDPKVQADIAQKMYDGITRWPWQVTVVRTTEEISNIRKKKRRGGGGDTPRRTPKVHTQKTTNTQ